MALPTTAIIAFCKLSYKPGCEMSIGLTPILAVGIAFISISVFLFRSKSATAGPTPDPRAVDQVVLEAMQKYREGKDIHSACPTCGSLLRVKTVAGDGDKVSVFVYCDCGACDGNYEFPAK